MSEIKQILTNFSNDKPWEIAKLEYLYGYLEAKWCYVHFRKITWIVKRKYVTALYFSDFVNSDED